MEPKSRAIAGVYGLLVSSGIRINGASIEIFNEALVAAAIGAFFEALVLSYIILFII